MRIPNEGFIGWSWRLTRPSWLGVAGCGTGWGGRKGREGFLTLALWPTGRPRMKADGRLSKTVRGARKLRWNLQLELENIVFVFFLKYLKVREWEGPVD